MSDILLAKPNLDDFWIDTTVGEPYLIRNILFDMFTWDEDVGGVDLSYPYPQGYAPLVKLLEDKHQAPVIITNGAKQALGSSFFALNQMSRTKMGMRDPYWALIPPLANMHGIYAVPLKEGLNTTRESLSVKFVDNSLISKIDSYLCIAPNNPDGAMPNDIEDLFRLCESLNIPFIFDGAYYSNIYTRDLYSNKTQLGDVEIYTFSKSLGLSGLRLGYAVCHNKEFYKHMCHYMESMTVGTSTISQKYLYNLLTVMKQDPAQFRSFEDRCYYSLLENKKELLKINPDVLELPENFIDSVGMFGWFKVGSKSDFNKVKIHTISGKAFGNEKMIRMNLAFENSVIKDLVSRLNAL